MSHRGLLFHCFTITNPTQRVGLEQSGPHHQFSKFLFGTGLNNSNNRCMNTQVFLVVESLPGQVHGENLANRELTPEQKTSAKFSVNIHDFCSSVYSITISMPPPKKWEYFSK